MLQVATRFAVSLLSVALLPAAWADTAPARCELTPKAANAVRLDLPCQFSQRQGFIGVTRADGVRHDFSPAAAAGRYTDEAKRPVRRRVDAGGQVFELPDARLSVRWLQGTAPAPTRLPPAPPVASGPFDRTLKLQGIAFRVQAANDSSVGQVRITPSGLKLDNTPVVREVDGQVVSAEVADLNVDGSPELYVVVQSAGSGSYASLVAVSANARKSLSDISLPALDTQAGAARGYQGHDQFAVVEGSLVRRMPIYLESDTNAQPTGGVRQLHYKLQKGEATWVLRLNLMSEF
jgi:hypothetical protein